MNQLPDLPDVSEAAVEKAIVQPSAQAEPAKLLATCARPSGCDCGTPNICCDYYLEPDEPPQPVQPAPETALMEIIASADGLSRYPALLAASGHYMPPVGTKLYAGVQPAATCLWTPLDDDSMPDTYTSACGATWAFIEGGAKDNGVKFCQGCGKPVEEQPESAAILPEKVITVTRIELTPEQREMLRVKTDVFIPGCAATVQPVQPSPTQPAYNQYWVGMDGTTAHHAISRNANTYTEVGQMMESWQSANPPPAHQPLKAAAQAVLDFWQEHLAHLGYGSNMGTAMRDLRRALEAQS